MKRSKLLNILSTSSVILTGLVPSITLSSCSNSETKQLTVLEQLEQATIQEFKDIAKYPHSSDKLLYKVPYESNVMALSNHLVKRAQELTGSKVYQDKWGNVWFEVPANDESLANNPTIALQAHMDMVFTYDPKKYEKGHEPDPATTVIDLVEETIDGKRVIHSKDYKTTIGADNGIGVAAILAIIGNNNIKHGKLKVIFTNCEENAMQGALLLVEGHRNDIGEIDIQPTAPAVFHNVKYVLNMDGGIGDTLSVACSGATGCHYNKSFEPIQPTLSNKFELKISGFKGGHSGGAVRQYLGNAIKAANEVLDILQGNDYNHVEIASFTTPGTEVYNRVASDCTVSFATDKTQQEINFAIAKVKQNHSDEEQTGEYGYWKDINDAKFELSTTNFNKVVDKDGSSKIIMLQRDLPYGRDEEKEKIGLKTSSNIGPSVLSLADNTFNFKTSTYSRSDDDDRVSIYKTSNLVIAQSNEFNFLCDAQFHPWVEETNKKLLNLVSKSLKENCGFEEIKTSKGHGGVEPAAWNWAMRNNEGIDDGNCVCIGVNVYNEHEATETIDVECIQKTMKVVQYIFAHSDELK